MKTSANRLKQILNVLFGIILTVTALTSCEKKDVYVPDTKVTLDDYFNFATSKTVQLNINYTIDGKVLFEVYGENPMKVVEGMVEKNTDLIAVAKGYTDEYGKYNLKATIPAAVTEVYIYSPSFGVPRLFKTKVTGNEIVANINFESAIDLSSLVTIESRANSPQQGGSLIMKNLNNKLCDWNKNGKPDNLSDTVIKVDKTMRQYLDTYLPEGGGNGVYKAYISDDADITLYEEASKVTLSYLGGETSAHSVLAYYCYPENATQAQIREAAANACVVFPNAHKDALGAYSGVSMDLQYINPAGKLAVGNFPKGTKIGFMIWNEGWKNSPMSKGNLFYSTKMLNAKNESHTAILGIKDNAGKNYNAISFEDWSQESGYDYNDVVFVIRSNPAEAIVVPPAPDPTPENYTETYQGILGFEDCWPFQGDYDMNDVVIKYNTNITCNPNNEIVSITDKFTLVWSGANMRNGFGYQFPFNMDGKRVAFTAKGSISGNIITLFDDAKKELNVENIPGQNMPSANPQQVIYVITTTFDVPVSKVGIVPPYNPFITINKTKIEVHLTNQKPTSGETGNVFPNKADISDGISTWYICEDGYPFAIHMDARKDPSLLNLDLKPETVRIDKTYPGFAEWAKTRNPEKKWW